MNKIKVSVVMSIFEENKILLKKSIDSILFQIFQDFEFIIILDNPTNLVAREYILQRQKDDDRIVFIQNKKNIQSGASLNKGIKIARGEYIALMDGDDTCDLSRLEKQFNYLFQHPQVDILFSGWEEINERGEKNVRIPSQIDFKNIKKTFFYKSPLLHASLMSRSSVLKNNKYSLISRAADFELFLSLISQGFVFDILSENLYSYYIDSYDVEKKYKKMKMFSSNFLIILSKNILIYLNNIYFWWMFLLVCIQWLLSRNKCIFNIFFNGLQKIYINLFIK